MKHLIFLIFLYAIQAHAQIKNIAGPVGSGDFGYSVAVLSNGNYVITDPYFIDGSVMNAGAVYLYNGKTHSLISTLKGSKINDLIGSDGIIALTNGNFVVISRLVDNGSVINAGGITWVNGTTGLEGILTPANSLMGSAVNDSLGSGGVIALKNGNYLVISPRWDRGPVVNAGAVTIVNGATAVSGSISSSNSLVGNSANDQVGSDGIEFLENGNFFVRSFAWDNGSAVDAGAVTWCDASTSITGIVSSTNSLVGSTTGDFIDDFSYDKIRELSNGNFVVVNPNWDNGDVFDAGAVTWGSAVSGIAGTISSINSLVGSTGVEQVGGGPGQDMGGVVALSNGNYVVATPGWDNGYIANAGAVTWGDGNTGVTGFIDATNSLVGSSVEDEVGSARWGWCGVVALSNGNYIVGTAFWNNGSIEDVGAVTWGNGITGIAGEVTPANSLVGSTAFDLIEYGNGYHIKMITPLSNGNFVISTPNWDNGNIVNAGAVTWANGNTSITGEINGNRSLIGSIANDELGYVTALSNGNFVACSPYWNNGAIADAGAVTWANGNTGITGFVSSSNSLVGTHANDNVGGANEVVVLSNGNYVACSQYWDNDIVLDAGAATWANGMTGITGPVSSSNSLVGTNGGDRVAFRVTTLVNGNYVVSSPAWNNGFGAATWASDITGVTGPVSSSNSLVGSHSPDYVGGSILPLLNGNYLVLSYEWDNTGPGTGKGALTWGNGLTGISGVVSSSNSLVGTSPGDFNNFHFRLAEDHYIFPTTTWDNGALTDVGSVTIGNAASGIAGMITSCNSVIGSSMNNGWQLRYDYNDTLGYMIVAHATHNVVTVFDPSGHEMPGSFDSALVNINGSAPVPLLSSDGCHIIATITAIGASPVNGNVKAKTWKETVVPEYNGHPFVARHYEITPTLNTSSATAKITLYFSQQEFDDFNAHAGSTTDLPVIEGDTSGIAKLRIIKYPGNSDDNTGLPGSYSGTPELIDPNNQDIAWNNNDDRWEVSFDVTGFSGFIVQTDIPILPLTLLEFKGRLVDRDALLNWKTSDEINTSSFDIERSADGRTFVPVGNVAAISQPGINTYAFTDVNIVSLGIPVVYYRLKLIDIDGRFTYSNIIALGVDNKTNIVFYPNPVTNNATLTIAVEEPIQLQVRILDDVGRMVRLEQWNIMPGNNSLQVNAGQLARGIYYLELKGKDINERVRFVKL